METRNNVAVAAAAVLLSGVLAGCQGEDTPSPWTYPSNTAPSPLAPFWSEGSSDDGVFQFAFATDKALDPSDIDDGTDIYIYDVETGELSFFEPEPVLDIEGFSVGGAVISGDGRYVAWSAGIAEWRYPDPSTVTQVYVRNLASGETTIASVSSSGSVGDWISGDPWISDDGRFVGFESYSTNLVPDDFNGGQYAFNRDFFIHDLLTRETGRVNVLPDGQVSDSLGGAGLAGNGEVIAFNSEVPMGEVYLRDLVAGQTIPLNLEKGVCGYLNPRWTYHYIDVSTDGAVVVFRTAYEETADADSDDGAVSGPDYIDQLCVVDMQSPEGPTGTVYGTFPESALWGFLLSGDGTTLAYTTRETFIRGDETGRRGRLFIVDLESGETEEIGIQAGGDEFDTSVTLSAVSPDGRYLVYMLEQSEPWVSMESLTYLLDRSTGESTLIVQDP